MHYNLGSSFGFIGFFNAIFRATVTFPSYGFCLVLIGFGKHFHFITHHKGAVKTQSKMTDNIGFTLSFIFFQKFFGAAKSYLVKVFIHLFGRHPNTLIGYGNGLFVGINFYGYI